MDPLGTWSAAYAFVDNVSVMQGISCITSIGPELDALARIQVSPNPFESLLYVTLPAFTQTFSQVFLFDAWGRQCTAQAVYPGQTQVAIITAGFATGMYSLIAESNGVRTRPIIVTHVSP